MLKTDLEGLIVILAAKSECEAKEFAKVLRKREKEKRRYRARLKQRRAAK